MAAKAPKIKVRAQVELVNPSGQLMSTGWGQNGIQEGTDLHNWGAYLRVPVPKVVGVTESYIVKVTYLGEKQYAQSYQQRVKAAEARERRAQKWQKEQERLKLERDERELVQRRDRIVNQIELAFVKKCRDAVDFITCDKCDATAKFLGLAYENPGSVVIDPEQITGAWCEEHDNKHQRPYKTKAAVACELLEFFYDGVRQICYKAAPLGQ